MLRTVKYRLYPTKKQITKLNFILRECCWIYNQLLNQRKLIYERNNISLSYINQIKYLTKLKEFDLEFKEIYAQVLQNVALRVDLAYKAFFRRCKSGEKAGYPRFKSWKRYDSFTYPQDIGFKLLNNRIKLSKIGTIKIKNKRQFSDILKICTIKRSSTGKWYATIVFEVDNNKLLSKTNNKIGIDVGLSSFASFSDGTKIANPRFFKKEEKELARAQRKLSKAEKGTEIREKCRKIVAQVHERIVNKRNDFAHKLSRSIINNNDIICIEDLQVNKMVHNHCLAKSISDAAWSQFFNFISYKAGEAGRILVKVDPAYTTQDCSRCDHRQKLSLNDRIYTCNCCGLILDRDYNAAINILSRGLSTLSNSSKSPLIRE